MFVPRIARTFSVSIAARNVKQNPKLPPKKFDVNDILKMSLPEGFEPPASTSSSESCAALQAAVMQSVPANDRGFGAISSSLYPKFQVGQIYSPIDFSYGKIKTARFARSQSGKDVFNLFELDPLHEYKNYSLLTSFVTEMGRIKPRSRTGLSAKNQRKTAKAIRRARAALILPHCHHHPNVMGLWFKAKSIYHKTPLPKRYHLDY